MACANKFASTTEEYRKEIIESAVAKNIRKCTSTWLTAFNAYCTKSSVDFADVSEELLASKLES